MDGHWQSQSKHNIDVDKLTKEAEAGHGHYIRSILDHVPFEEQIRIAHEMTNLSREHNRLAGCPWVELIMQNDSSDGNSGYGYSSVQLYRLTPNKVLGSLLPKTELLYESTLNLTTGEKAAADNNR